MNENDKQLLLSRTLTLLSSLRPLNSHVSELSSVIKQMKDMVLKRNTQIAVKSYVDNNSSIARILEETIQIDKMMVEIDSLKKEIESELVYSLSYLKQCVEMVNDGVGNVSKLRYIIAEISRILVPIKQDFCSPCSVDILLSMMFIIERSEVIKDKILYRVEIERLISIIK